MVSTVCQQVVAPPAPCTRNTGFIANATSTGNPLRTVEPNLVIPESYQLNLGFEREIAKGWIFEANYTWNKTVHLWRDRNGNVPILPQGFQDWTSWLTANPFVLSPTRRYTFFLGTPTDATGLHAGSPDGGNCGVTTANCFVNLNTTSSSSATPLVAAAGVNNNATGGPIGIALAAIGRFRPNPNVAETSVIRSRGNAFYRGLVLELRTKTR